MLDERSGCRFVIRTGLALNCGSSVDRGKRDPLYVPIAGVVSDRPPGEGNHCMCSFEFE